MISDASERVDAGRHVPLAFPILSAPRGGGLVDEGILELSPRLRADLLDLNAWGEILSTYGRTMGVAVALTDSEGNVLGTCHNAQPVWRLVRDATPGWTAGAGCPFCITKDLPCAAVAEALQTGGAIRVRDQVGLTHVAVPLFLGKQHLGAIIAGQVFDRYPDPLPLRRVARDYGVSAQQLWDVARRQRPISSAILQASGDLLCALGHAFLQQRYGAILEANLADTNGQFRLLVEETKDYALFTMDQTGRVLSWNIGAERLLGYPEAEIVGRSFSCIFTPKDIQNHEPEKQLNKAAQAGRSEDEGWRVRMSRERFLASVNITALFEDAGSVHGFAIIIQDVTERRKVATLLEEGRQERSRLQEKFLSHVSHELRTPLTAIYFFITNVLDGLLGDLTPKQHEHLAFALDNVKQLRDMVSDLLDITRVETHKLVVEPQYASPVKLIAEVLSTCRRNAAIRSVRLRSDIAPGLPFVWADPARVRQILTNLIDNGIKFTPEGGTVTVASRTVVGDDGFQCLSVSDTGCGISPENREIIFNRLAQLKSSAEASRSGLGLGLFIARELVSRHGGRIWVESQLGFGSTFCFTLPVFSLAKMCAHVLTASNLEAGFVIVIAVDVVAVEGAVREDIVPEIRRVLEHCIHAGQDVLLPSMREAEPVETFFIVACTDPSKFPVIASRISRELLKFDGASKLKPAISSTTLPVTPGESTDEQIRKLMEGIERSVQSHLQGKESFK
jgi:PAS domain S-box-containing protein